MVLGYNFDKNRNIKRATIQGAQFTNMGRLWGSLGSMNPTPAPATSSTYVLFNHQPEARGHPSALPGFPILGLREHSDAHPTPFLTLSRNRWFHLPARSQKHNPRHPTLNSRTIPVSGEAALPSSNPALRSHQLFQSSRFRPLPFPLCLLLRRPPQERAVSREDGGHLCCLLPSVRPKFDLLLLPSNSLAVSDEGPLSPVSMFFGHSFVSSKTPIPVFLMLSVCPLASAPYCLLNTKMARLLERAASHVNLHSPWLLPFSNAVTSPQTPEPVAFLGPHASLLTLLWYLRLNTRSNLDSMFLPFPFSSLSTAFPLLPVRPKSSCSSLPRFSYQVPFFPTLSGLCHSGPPCPWPRPAASLIRPHVLQPPGLCSLCWQSLHWPSTI